MGSISEVIGYKKGIKDRRYIYHLYANGQYIESKILTKIEKIAVENTRIICEGQLRKI